jgi:predicted MFS family arabinose efflux permease
LFGLLTVQGFAFGLLFAVGTIASQEFVENHIKGMSTSLQIFIRNIGTSIGVTVMGVFINHAATMVIGMKNIYLFALCVSVLSFVITFLIPSKSPIGSEG